MIRAELRLGSDGVQILGLVYSGRRLLDIIAGPADRVMGSLPDHGVGIADVTGMTEEYRALWGTRKERPAIL